MLHPETVPSTSRENVWHVKEQPINILVDQASGSVSIVAVGILTSVAGRFSAVASPSTLVAVFSAQSKVISTLAPCKTARIQQDQIDKGAHTGRHVNRLQNALPIRQNTCNSYSEVSVHKTTK